MEAALVYSQETGRERPTDSLLNVQLEDSLLCFRAGMVLDTVAITFFLSFLWIVNFT